MMLIHHGNDELLRTTNNEQFFWEMAWNWIGLDLLSHYRLLTLIRLLKIERIT
jgi:hypothetical protein